MIRFLSNQSTNLKLSEDVRVELRPEEPAAPAVRRVLRALAGEMMSSRDGLLDDVDPRYLHRYRIAIRRTRTIFSELKWLFRVEDYRRLGPELKWISEPTSPVRDLDVFIIRLDAVDGTADAAHRSGPVAELIREDRDGAFRQVEAAIGSDRYQTFLAEWVEFLDEPDEVPELHEAPEQADRPVLEVASAAILKAFRRVERRSRDLLASENISDSALHKLRIACKKVRYLIEAFASLYEPEDIEATLTALRRLQDVLGDYNDAVLQRSRIERYRTRLPADEMTAEAGAFLDRIDRELTNVATQRRADFVDSMTDFVSAENLAEIERTFSSLETQEQVEGH